MFLFIIVSVFRVRCEECFEPPGEVSTSVKLEFLLTSILYSALYALLENNFDSFETTIRSCMDKFISSKTFEDTAANHSNDEVSGSKILGTLITLMFE